MSAVGGRPRRLYRCVRDGWGPHCWAGSSVDPLVCTSLRGWVLRRRGSGVCAAIGGEDVSARFFVSLAAVACRTIRR